MNKRGYCEREGRWSAGNEVVSEKKNNEKEIDGEEESNRQLVNKGSKGYVDVSVNACASKHMST